MTKKRKLAYNFWQLNKRFTTAEKIQLVLSYILRLSIIIAIIGFLIKQHWIAIFVSLCALGLSFMPAMIRKNYKISLPMPFELAIVVFVYASVFLGEVRGFYTTLWWWDIVLHGCASVILGLLGFITLFILYYEGQIRASPKLIAFFSFSFALAIGALWEIFEFSMDIVFKMNMQRSGLMDTMGDLIADAAFALIVALVGYFYLKRKRKEGWFHKILAMFFKTNPQLIRKEFFAKSKYFFRRTK